MALERRFEVVGADGGRGTESEFTGEVVVTVVEELMAVDGGGPPTSVFDPVPESAHADTRAMARLKASTTRL